MDAPFTGVCGDEPHLLVIVERKVETSRQRLVRFEAMAVAGPAI